jgi:hypothetical protein
MRGFRLALNFWILERARARFWSAANLSNTPYALRIGITIGDITTGDRPRLTAAPLSHSRSISPLGELLSLDSLRSPFGPACGCYFASLRFLTPAPLRGSERSFLTGFEDRVACAIVDGGTIRSINIHTACRCKNMRRRCYRFADKSAPTGITNTCMSRARRNAATDTAKFKQFCRMVFSPPALNTGIAN